jgi:hypothetical protein
MAWSYNIRSPCCKAAVKNKTEILGAKMRCGLRGRNKERKGEEGKEEKEKEKWLAGS